MIALALAALLYAAPTPDPTPAPSESVAAATPTPDPTTIAPPNEGRPNGAGGWDPTPDPTAVVTPSAVAVPVRPVGVTPRHTVARPELAETGVPVAPYVAVAAAMIATGAGLLEVARRRAAEERS